MKGYNLPDNVSPGSPEEANAEIDRLQEENQELVLRLAGLQGKYNYLVSVCRANKILPPIY